MDKRTFLKSSCSILTGTMLSRLIPAAQAQAAMQGPHTNWAGNYTFHPAHYYEPGTLPELQHLIASNPKVRALGRAHSFNGIADTTATQISLKHFDSIALDPAARTVTVGAGVTYGALAPYIDTRGFAVHNLASLPHVSVVGACATATHGSGSHNGNLATIVSAVEFVAADGTLHTLARKDGDLFHAAAVNLGALGVITRITLDVVPSFQVAQVVYRDLSFNVLEHHLDELFLSGYSVSIFTDWQNHSAAEVWVKRRVEPNTKPSFPTELFGAKPATVKLHPIPTHPAEACTDQLGVPGPWYERLPHFKMNFTPSSGQEIQAEFFVPRDRAYQAILAVESLRDRITPHLFVTELRTIAADDLWLSMAYQRPSLAIHFTFKPEAAAVQALLPLIEAKLAPFDARPHWAKVFTVPSARLAHLYPKMDAFKAAVAHYDPKAKLRNHFIDTTLYGA